MKTILINQKTSKEISVTEDTQYVILSGPQNGEIFLNLVFKKQGVTAEILGIFDLPKGAGVKLETSSKHIAPDTSCITYIKTVLNDGSFFDYRGKIKIEKSAKKTTAYLHDNVLVVGEKTRRNSQPTLEIDTNDVKASHGSTTGRIDENQLYYLESRGLKKAEAEEILKEGFLTELVGRIKDKDTREKVLNTLKFMREDI
jgi:Fe-S cluster assembly protein SufD